jgi:anti-anti-sigma regulatory factor
MSEQTQTGGIEIPGPDVKLSVVRSGEWLPPEELQGALLARVMEASNTILDFGDIEHLDASSLQMLLAFFLERERAGKTVALRHVSNALAEWFGHVGATSIAELELAQRA